MEGFIIWNIFLVGFFNLTLSIHVMNKVEDFVEELRTHKNQPPVKNLKVSLIISSENFSILKTNQVTTD